jgi:hypothetical protein
MGANNCGGVETLKEVQLRWDGVGLECADPLRT